MSQADASGEWGPDKYFDEKWTHTTGRLSDFTPPKDNPSDSRHPSRRSSPTLLKFVKMLQVK